MCSKQTSKDRLLPESVCRPDKLQVNRLLNQADGTFIPPYVRRVPDGRLFICGFLSKHASRPHTSWDVSSEEALELSVPSQRADVLLSRISNTGASAEVFISTQMERKKVLHFLYSSLLSAINI